MVTKIKNGRLILADEIVEGENLYFADGKITAITSDDLPADREIDASGKYISSGFIDIHVHGGDGYDFCTGDEESLLKAANIHGRHGTTTIFPTISAYSEDVIAKSLEMIEKYGKHKDLIPNIYGAHLEGPYFSLKQSGAQDPEFIRNPDPTEYGRLIQRYGKVISRWSYAPENPGSVEFQKYLNENGIIGAVAHSDAEYEHVKDVYDFGCKLITHLYSCTSTITRKGGFRHLGVIETAYLLDDMDVETIADGCHLPPLLLKMIYKIKGPENMCLVTDAIRFGGCSAEPGRLYGSGSVQYLIEDGVAKLADRSAFAGSVATADSLIRVCTRQAGIPLVQAVKMMTHVPARIMNLPTKGCLAKGYDADILIFDDNIQIQNVIVGGEVRV